MDSDQAHYTKGLVGVIQLF